MRWLGLVTFGSSRSSRPLTILSSGLLSLLVALTGCGVTVTRFQLQPQANTCQHTEVRRVLSTVARIDCWGVRQQYLGAVGGMGMPLIQGPIEGVKAAATLGAGFFIFKAGEAISGTTIRHVGTGTVTLEPSPGLLDALEPWMGP